MSTDLTIETALDDPMIRAVMRADGVSRHELDTMLRSTARLIERAPVRRPLMAGLLNGKPACKTPWGLCFA